MKFTCVAFLVCLGVGEGLMLDEGGGLFSLAGLDEGNTLDTTGWFFFPEGSSVGASAGRFIPPIPPTACRQIKSEMAERRQSRTLRDTQWILTRGASMEVVVVLWDIRQDTEAIRDLKRHHIFCIQQRWNSQLPLRNPERLQITLTLSNKTEAHGGILEFQLL